MSPDPLFSDGVWARDQHTLLYYTALYLSIVVSHLIASFHSFRCCVDPIYIVHACTVMHHYKLGHCRMWNMERNWWASQCMIRFLIIVIYSHKHICDEQLQNRVPGNTMLGSHSAFHHSQYEKVGKSKVPYCKQREAGQGHAWEQYQMNSSSYASTQLLAIIRFR